MNFIFINCFAITILIAQINLDSLIKSNSSLSKTEQIEILLNYCWAYRSRDPQFSIQCAKEAIKRAESIQNKKLKAKALNLLGVVYRNLGYHEKALSLYNEALSLSIESNDSIQIAFSFNNIGGIYRLQGNNPLALEYVLKALRIFEKFNFIEGIAFCTINIGLIYKNQEDYDNSLSYLERTLELRKQLDDKQGIALTLNLMGEVFYSKRDIENAMKYYKLSEAIYKNLKDKRGLASVWGGMGNVYEAKNDIKNALNYHKRALEYSKRTSYMEGQIMNYNKLAILYAKKNDFSKAEEYLKDAQKLAEKTKTAYLLLECYKHWINYNEIIKNYEKAFEFSQKYITLKDSLMNERNIMAVKSMEAFYKAEKAAKENTLLMKDIQMTEKQRDYFIVITLLILLISVITYSRYITKKVANEKLKELNSMKDTLFRIIAHDLRIPFNTIFGYLGLLRDNFNSLDDDEKLSYIVNMEKAAKQNLHLLENLLLWSRSQTGRLEIELKPLDLQEIVMENFSMLSSIANNKNITLQTNIVDGVKVLADENMLNTILRNLIQNSIKFTNIGGKVTVDSLEEDEFVKVIVEDNGIGIDKEIMDKIFQLDGNKSRTGTIGESGTGLGLILCKEFVEKLGGKIQVESEVNKGSKFIFTLPSA
ncbi:MAG: tetratricopeptide repeat-containing sensor histidine kinase [Melioribacter sp.]|nr:tetratricopeptide repeat-containing sensor histidine kinase [Melioribacter sp.]